MKINPIIWFLGTIVVILIYKLVFFNVIVEEGDYTGQVTKLSEKGLLWKTWEGTLGVMNIKLSLGSRSYLDNWRFSVDNKNPEKEKLTQDLTNTHNSGKIVKISYIKRFTSLPWRAETTRIIKNITPLNDFYNQMIRGDEAYVSKNYNSVIIEGQKMLEIATDNYEKSIAHFYIGLGLYTLGKKEESQKEEELALSLNPQNPGPYVVLGAIMLDKEDTKKAKELVQKAIELNPKWSWGYNLMGQILAAEGNKEEGIKYIKKAIELEPDSEGFKNNLKLIEEGY